MSNAVTLKKLETKLSNLEARELESADRAAESAASSARKRVQSAYAGKRAVLKAQIDALSAIVLAEEESRLATGRAKPGPKPRGEDIA